MSTPITERELVATNIACLTLTSIFVVGRIAIQIKNKKRPQPTDYFLYAGIMLYFATWLCYFFVIPAVFRVYSVSSGRISAYPSIQRDVSSFLILCHFHELQLLQCISFTAQTIIFSETARHGC